MQTPRKKSPEEIRAGERYVDRMLSSFGGRFAPSSLRAAAIVALSAAAVLAMPATARAHTRAETPAVVVTPVLSAVATAAGQPIRLPGGDARVIVSRYLIAPGARLPNHRHPYPRYAYVEQGKLRVTDVASGRSFNYKQGDVAIEVVNRVHFGINTGTIPLKLLVMDFVPKAQTGNTTIGASTNHSGGSLRVPEQGTR